MDVSGDTDVDSLTVLQTMNGRRKELELMHSFTFVFILFISLCGVY